MKKHDRIISDLINALDVIRREAHERASEESCAYIFGVAGMAIQQCNAHRERNSDGYLVVKAD